MVLVEASFEGVMGGSLAVARVVRGAGVGGVGRPVAFAADVGVVVAVVVVQGLIALVEFDEMNVIEATDGIGVFGGVEGEDALGAVGGIGAGWGPTVADYCATAGDLWQDLG